MGKDKPPIDDKKHTAQIIPFVRPKTAPEDSSTVEDVLEEMKHRHLAMCIELNKKDITLSRIESNTELLIHNRTRPMFAVNLDDKEVSGLQDLLVKMFEQVSKNRSILNTSILFQEHLNLKSVFSDGDIKYFEDIISDVESRIRETDEYIKIVGNMVSMDLVNGNFYDSSKITFMANGEKQIDLLTENFIRSTKLLEKKLDEIDTRAALVEVKIKSSMRGGSFSEMDKFTSELLDLLEMGVHTDDARKELFKSQRLQVSLKARRRVPIMSQSLITIKQRNIQRQLILNEEWIKEIDAMLLKVYELLGSFDVGGGNDTPPSPLGVA